MFWLLLLRDYLIPSFPVWGKLIFYLIWFGYDEVRHSSGRGVNLLYLLCTKQKLKVVSLLSFSSLNQRGTMQRSFFQLRRVSLPSGNHRSSRMFTNLWNYLIILTFFPPFTPADLFKYRLVNCKLVNSTFLHNKEGCMLDFSDDFNNAYMIYFVNFLGTLAVLPGNIVSALLMDKIGRLRMLGRLV